MVNVLELGDIVPLTVDIRDASGVLANAGAVTLTITLPDGSTATPAVSNPTPGRYQADYIAPVVGRYLVRWVATGTNQSAYDDTFVVVGLPATTAWPPLLQDVKADMGVSDSRDDDTLATVLAAAVAHVEMQRAGEFNFTGDPLSLLPAPDSSLRLGTVRLAVRWHTLRRSPDGLIDMGELGRARVPSIAPDVERLLGIGRFRAPMVG